MPRAVGTPNNVADPGESVTRFILAEQTQVWADLGWKSSFYRSRPNV
jgi:hypothetical protein